MLIDANHPVGKPPPQRTAARLLTKEVVRVTRVMLPVMLERAAVSRERGPWKPAAPSRILSRQDRLPHRKPSGEPFVCQGFLSSGEELEPSLRSGRQDGPAPPDESGAPTELLLIKKGDVDVGEFPPFELKAGEEGDADARRHEGHDEIKLAAAQALVELQPALAADGLDAVVEQEALLEADEGVVGQLIHFEAFAIREGMIRGHDDHERFVPDLEPRKIRRDGEEGDGNIEIA